MNSHETVPPPAVKIGGFLIVVAIGLVLSLLKNLEALAWSLIPLRGEVWERLTTPGSGVYHPNWKPALVFGIISASVTLALNAILLVLFFRKHRFFPKFTVAAIPVIFVLMLVGYYLEGLVPAIAETAAYGKQWHALIVKFLALHLWIPYFVISDRVKRTFVR